jgi:hypothetical protein
MNTLNLPSIYSDEITYKLNEEELESLINRLGIVISDLMLLVKYRKTKTEIELIEYKTYSIKLSKTWTKVTKEVGEIIDSLLDEEKVKTITINIFKKSVEL